MDKRRTRGRRYICGRFIMKSILIIIFLISSSQPSVHHIEFNSMKSCEVAKERTINAIDKRYNRGYFVYCVEKGEVE